ncbi:MAG: sulfite exporter TauE/SafE family protein [Candidatus Promineifilaceae bacterium]
MELLLAVLFFLIAALYSAVGLGGGSGYLAVMGLAGVPPDVMRPVALSLNILVASISSWFYIRSGHFSARIFWPVVLASMPFAYLGGYLELPGHIYRPLVGLLLIYSAVRLWRSTVPGRTLPAVRADLPLWMLIAAGAAIGFVSGLMGIGGGTFLGPLLLLAGWVDTRDALGITAAFVLANSISALAGRMTAVPDLPSTIWIWLAAAGIGGWLGARLGSRRLDPRLLRRLLALILLLGGLRLVLSF